MDNYEGLKVFTIGDYRFVQTCSCSPEQYDVFDKDGNQVCYVRLRWGSLYAECPDVGGTTVYEAGTGSGWAGCFESESQRLTHLRNIAQEIEKFNNYTCSDCAWHDWEDKDDLGFERIMVCDEGHNERCGMNCKACGDFCPEFDDYDEED